MQINVSVYLSLTFYHMIGNGGNAPQYNMWKNKYWLKFIFYHSHINFNIKHIFGKDMRMGFSKKIIRY